ncbi:hypothetical protein [uncultured Helicobacter sp.]|uniref:hypothetical protein n=1 Tax=uncultured Helicobacter sp. TaxID=175537 RepID=UPI002607E58E|nr:hypothetical protein [uncultured Helicobacter sp.]
MFGILGFTGGVIMSQSDRFKCYGINSDAELTAAIEYAVQNFAMGANVDNLRAMLRETAITESNYGRAIYNNKRGFGYGAFQFDSIGMKQALLVAESKGQLNKIRLLSLTTSLGIFKLSEALKTAGGEALSDERVLSEADVINISNAPRYAGKSWEQVKAELLNQNALVRMFDSMPSLQGFALSIVGISKYAFNSIVEYKNPIRAAKEDVKMIFKGAGIVFTTGAILALAWKVALIYMAYKAVRKGV